MTLYSRKEAAAILGVSMTTLDKMREDRKIGYLQARPGGQVQLTLSLFYIYWLSIDLVGREIYGLKAMNVFAEV